MAVHTITAKNINALAGNDYPEAWRVSETLRGLITRVEARMLDWYRYRSTVAELNRLGDSDLADIGIARPDIRAVARAAAFPAVI
jgi:uncharacterized protein YjiS (DUF1127 family)